MACSRRASSSSPCWFHTLPVPMNPQNQDASVPFAKVQPFTTKGRVYLRVDTFMFQFWGIPGGCWVRPPKREGQRLRWLVSVGCSACFLSPGQW